MSPSDSDGTRIGNRYRLDERIGAGAMGAVWRGTDELLNRTVAIKELLAAAVSPSSPGDALEESRQRILREGRIGARLQHAHVISMFDVVVHDDRPWLVMEYLPSRSLAVVLGEKGPMAPREAAAIGQQVADGLAAAHAAGVVHRDIKPGNVLIAEDGRAKITDFGVSRAVDDVQLTRTGMIAGTPAFLAPEVARGQQPTSASDVFALGATLYAAVEGAPPFGLDDNAYALLHKVATGAVRPPTEAGPLTALLMRLLADDPEQRPTASQARDALAVVAAGRPAPDSGTPGASGTAVLPVGPFTPSAASAAESAQAPRTLSEIDAPAAAKSGPPTPPPAGGAGPAREAAEPSPRRRRRAPILLGLLAVVLVAGIGVVIGIVRASSSGAASTGAALPAAPTSVASAPSAAPATSAAPRTTTPVTSAAPTSAPTSASTSAANPPAAPGDAVAFVQNYYSLLPGNVDAAFAMLSPAAQAQSGGIDGFRRFYAGLSSVNVESARSVGDNTVEATIIFQRQDGTTTREPYRFVIGQGNDGNLIMQSFSRA
ncbi:serine/threonine-protein kinase [Pseudonocardia acidicola]|uniref:non-specific serine/threonine protein kinase n=1 Tax=Pseudonocardia acidicola TaxID=2724939 RepID=A0ABX1SFC8_9PSEU|nr:serine/threonine-protein kinase [Pseudonocardia acidicola]NMI00254.1 protein kinase [Pseudonocardia acidicola]